MAAKNKEPEKERSTEMDAAVEPVRLIRRHRLALTSLGSLLKQFAKTVP